MYYQLIGGSMMHRKALFFIISIFFVFGALFATDIEKNRDSVPDQYKWDLTELYPDVSAWKSDVADVNERMKKIGSFEGKLGNSAGDLLAALDYYFDVHKQYVRLSTYASQLSDQDKRESGPLAMEQEISQVGTNFDKVSAYLKPEILSIPADKLAGFIGSEKGLQKYSQYLDNIVRGKTHTLDSKGEMIVAEAGRMSSSPYDIFSIFTSADMPRPTVKLSDGTEVRLDAAGYGGNRARANREDRITVFEAFFGGLNDYRRTLGTQLNAEVQKNIFFANVRNYESSLESALDENNIPVSVYHKLIENINNNLPTLHRYLKLRKKMLGLDELHYYDMYPSLVKSVDLAYDYDEAMNLMLESFTVLGSDYVAVVDKSFKDRWIDVYPNTGKRSGAYSSGNAYDVHPYILLNYNGKYDDVSTLAHELGHTMHSYFSNVNQEYVNADYPIFLAEVASTANEAILMDHMLKKLDDPQKRLSLLGSYLENARQTVFRQTQFAEFELKIHELAESGVALTGDKFTEVYMEILKKYYGHDQGITVIDDLYAIEWAYIPHFYYNFYVFQYSTSFLASQVLAEKMLSGEPGMVDKYLEFLSSGNSDYAIPTLKKVGIDMTTDEPFKITMAKMNRVMDEIEALLQQMGK
jgi:oligoendopeptidase F